MIDIERAIAILKYYRPVAAFNAGFKGPQSEDVKAFNLAITALEERLNGGWTPFTAEYDEDYKIDTLNGKLPDEEQEILVTNGKYVWMDEFMRDGIEYYLDSGEELISEAKAWMPKPEPYKEAKRE